MSIRRIGQRTDPKITPSYRLIEECLSFFIGEYCGTWKVFPKSHYELVK